jgi:hypothetical protein
MLLVMPVFCAAVGLPRPVRGAADEQGPRVFLLERSALRETQRRVAAGDEELAPAVARLRREADEALQAGPFSLVEKKTLPPSGDKHDYMSVGPYWWPNPKTPDGKPYVRRDGYTNPERHRYDNVPLGRMCGAVNTLALAYYLTGREPYAAQAARLLRTWFLDPATRMNPNLTYAQAIPGICDGRGIGIIDTTGLAQLVDAVGLLAESKAWTKADQQALQAWFREYLQWMLTSKQGQEESRAKNNHGTWYDVQAASFALFVGDEGTAREVLGQAAARRIAAQIEPDGRQARELARTKSFGYSSMNLHGMFQLAVLGWHFGVDLWNFQTDDGRGVRKALDWMLPFVVGEKPWEYEQIEPLRPGRFFPLLRRAAIAYREPRYEKVIANLPEVEPADRVNLLYPRPRFE